MFDSAGSCKMLYLSYLHQAVLGRHVPFRCHKKAYNLFLYCLCQGCFARLDSEVAQARAHVLDTVHLCRLHSKGTRQRWTSGARRSRRNRLRMRPSWTMHRMMPSTSKAHQVYLCHDNLHSLCVRMSHSICTFCLVAAATQTFADMLWPS